MGLDMFAFTRTTKPERPVDFEETSGDTELAYWRKHPNLHGWMETLYRDKGGSKDSFNCAPVVLDLDDLDRLQTAINVRLLPETEGFFFGQSDGSERDEDLAFVAAAREAIAAGLTVYYTSWW